MKFKLVVISLVCLAVLGLSGPALLLAQGELSLEDLSEQLQALADKVTALTERVDAIEALGINSEPIRLQDGSCVVGSRGGMHAATVLSYRETFDEWPDPDDIRVIGVSYNPETGVILIHYQELFTNMSIFELWHGCEYIENSNWWEGDYNDKAFEVYIETPE